MQDLVSALELLQAKVEFLKLTSLSIAVHYISWLTRGSYVAIYLYSEIINKYLASYI